LLGDEFNIRLGATQQLLEPAHGGLAVFIVRRDGRPALDRELRRLLHQHGRLHVGAGTEPEGIPVALAPDERIGQGLAGHEEAPVLVGEIAERQSDIGQEAAGQQADLLGIHQLSGQANRILRPSGIVAEDGFDPPADDAAGGVDLLLRQHPGIAVGLQEGGLGGVAVDLADADRLALRSGQARRRQSRHAGTRQYLAAPDRLSHHEAPGLAATAKGDMEPQYPLSCKRFSRP
jgi:hypothetical protein